LSDINELFARDPLKLSREDIAEIVNYYISKRQQFNLGDKTAGKTKKKENGPKISNLDDLLGEII
jgi:hypothetical protein